MNRYRSESRLHFWLVIVGDILAFMAVVFIGVALMAYTGVIPHGWPRSLSSIQSPFRGGIGFAV